jgi:hypothetical protein
MKHYLIILLAALLFSLNSSNKNMIINNLNYSHYDIHLKILPEKQFIKVSGKLKYLVTKDSLNEFVFRLHRNMIINKFSLNGDNFYQLDTGKSEIRYMPDAMKIIYHTKKEYYKGDILNIKFSYSGKIAHWPGWSANVISPDWVELGLYFPWYPAFSGLFTYKVSVDMDTAYHVFARGTASKKGTNRIFEEKSPVQDFNICASKDLNIRETKLMNRSFKIVNTTLSDNLVDTALLDIENIYKTYRTWFGEIQVPDMCLVVSKRKKGGGYSRNGALFLAKLNDVGYLNRRMDYIRYLAHEIAHFWWHGAPSTWEDWLNESFAEYSALRLIRDCYSLKEFNMRLNKKKEESKNTPPIWKMSRNNPKAGKVLYSKGVVLLYELEQKIGTEKFLELCKVRVAKKINNTEDFLNLLNAIGGKNVAGWFEQSLKTR